jgi:hypothetical protein
LTVSVLLIFMVKIVAYTTKKFENFTKYRSTHSLQTQYFHFCVLNAPDCNRLVQFQNAIMPEVAQCYGSNSVALNVSLRTKYFILPNIDARGPEARCLGQPCRLPP